jgi:hypothetical protein
MKTRRFDRKERKGSKNVGAGFIPPFFVAFVRFVVKTRRKPCARTFLQSSRSCPGVGHQLLRHSRPRRAGADDEITSGR